MRGPVAWFRFNRPPRNAIHWEMLEELAPAFESLMARAEIRVVVLASTVDRFFSSGADVSGFAGLEPDGMRHWVGVTHGFARRIREAPKPILAAINGVAVGGGLEMSLHADLRFAASDARLGQPEINIGFIPPVAGTQALVRLVGRSRAFQILYGGELMDAKSALEIGWVDFISPPEKLIAYVQAYGEMLASKPANTLAAIRRCLIDGGGMSFDDGLEVEKAQAIALAGHANFNEGVASFLEKRAPKWV